MTASISQQRGGKTEFEQRRRRQSNEKLPISLVLRLDELFVSKGWAKDERGLDRYNRFCRILEILDPSQRELLLELTSDFLYSDHGHCMNSIYEAICQLKGVLDDSILKIYVLPMLPIARFTHIKSQHMLHYSMESEKLIYKQKLGKELIFVRRLDEVGLFSDSKINDGPAVLLLVDDFIGTGDSALEAIQSLSENLGYRKDKMLVLCAVAQKRGVEKINDHGVRVICPNIRLRGISDKYDSPTREELLDVMARIEDMLNLQDAYRRGYGKSEALVAMIKTPNNTFPIFWREFTDKDGQSIKPPFPR